METEPTPETLSVTFALTTEDIDAVQKYYEKREPQMSLWAVILFVFVIIGGGIGIALLFGKQQNPTRPPMTLSQWGQLLVPLTMIVFFSFLLTGWQKRNQRHAAHKQPRAFFALRTVTISPEGYRESLTESEFFHRWKAVSEISDEESHYLILLPENNAATPACIIPKSAFSDQKQAETFIERARAFRRAVRAESVTA